VTLYKSHSFLLADANVKVKKGPILFFCSKKEPFIWLYVDILAKDFSFFKFFEYILIWNQRNRKKFWLFNVTPIGKNGCFDILIYLSISIYLLSIYINIIWAYRCLSVGMWRVNALILIKFCTHIPTCQSQS